jgi:UPF0755 protein
MTALYDDEAVYEPMRTPSGGGGRRLLKAFLAVLVVGLLSASAVGFWVVKQIGGSPGGAEVSIELPRGASTARIAAILDEEGVISSARMFRLYARVTGAGPFKAGGYTFRKHQSFSSVAKTLDKGPKLVFQRLTVPEGLTLVQIADRVGKLPGRSAEKFLEVARSGTVRSQFQPADSVNLEGLTLAETYEFEPKDDEVAILKRMVEAFDAVAVEVGLDQAPAKLGLTPYQAVIVASLIEEEAKIPEDRPKMARVIYNRLARKERLGIDATLRYGLNRPTQPLRVSDLDSDTPYNTRKFAGLPPTPIAAPGRAALEATMSPAEGPWIFYVLDPDQSRTPKGGHFFTDSAREFEVVKAECRKADLGCG